MSNEENTSNQNHSGIPIDLSLIRNSVAPELQQLPTMSPTRRRGRLFHALEATNKPHTYIVRPKVLKRAEIDLVRNTLTEDNPTRAQALLRVQEANREIRSRITRVGIILDGRGQEWDENGVLIKTPDGWWGDTGQASSVIRAAHADGLEVMVFSPQPDLFYREGDDRISYVRIPDETFPFQFYPFKNANHMDMIEFLHSQQKPNMAYWAPTNSRLPMYFRLEKHRGDIRFDTRSRTVVDALQMAVEGAITDNFEGITQKIWNRICHHTQAYQVATEIMGLYREQWEQFPRPYINPTPFAELIAQSIVRQLSQTGVNALLHIGSATNTPRKREKFYPVEKWIDVLTHIATKQPDLVGSVIIFKPINPHQAALSEKVAEHAIGVFGEERVVVVPLHRDWNLSALAALMRHIGESGNGIALGIDSGPAHIARAQDAPLVEIGNKAFDPEYYAPQGGMIVLPAKGESAKSVSPEEIAEAFITLASTPEIN